MRENLILKKYKQEPVNGTFNILEEPTFFSSKVMELEDDILLNNESIQYFQYFYNAKDQTQIEQNLTKNNGYQYNILNKYQETFFLLDVVELKLDNHTITQVSQNEIDKNNNTKWEIDVDIKNILKQYIFAKIKERRTFKSINYYNFINKNINESIYDYITYNILDRYEFNYIDFYVKYNDIKNTSIYSNIRQFNPIFKSDIEDISHKTTGVNVQINNFVDSLANLKITYLQTKPSTDYTFDYYFNIYFKKI